MTPSHACLIGELFVLKDKLARARDALDTTSAILAPLKEDPRVAEALGIIQKEKEKRNV